jgi:hypothetical protein
MDTPSAIVANVALLGMLPLHWIDPTFGLEGWQLAAIMRE